MNTYVITFDNPHYCGGEHTVLIDADSECTAEDNAHDFMSDYQYSLFSEQYEEDEDLKDECNYSVISVELFDENHPHWDIRHSFEKI